MWRARCLAFILVPAVVDGVYLGGVAAIISAVGGIIVAVLGYKKGASSNGSLTLEAWRLLAEERAREIERLEQELDRERQRLG